MRILTRLAAGLAILVAVLVLVAYLLPREVTVTRSITIDAPPSAVFPHVNSLQRFAEWSPWGDIDPDMVQTFSGPAEGVGNRMEWTSEDDRVGSGSQEITLSLPDERVETALDFGDMGLGAAWQEIRPVDGASEVTWGLVADMGLNPIGRWMGLMMDRLVGADYERGLERLKAVVEAG